MCAKNDEEKKGNVVENSVKPKGEFLMGGYSMLAITAMFVLLWMVLFVSVQKAGYDIELVQAEMNVQGFRISLNEIRSAKNEDSLEKLGKTHEEMMAGYKASLNHLLEATNANAKLAKKNAGVVWSVNSKLKNTLASMGVADDTFITFKPLVKKTGKGKKVKEVTVTRVVKGKPVVFASIGAAKAHDCKAVKAAAKALAKAEKKAKKLAAMKKACEDTGACD